MRYNTLINHAIKWRDFILNVIFPIECINCGCESKWLCEDCFNKIPYNSHQYCLNCKKINSLGEFCTNCQNNYYLNNIWIAGNYDNPLLSKLIKYLKYHFIKDIAVVLGKYLCNYTKSKRDVFNKINNNTLIIPVPLHKKRSSWRGFNQSEIIADYIANFFNLPINKNCLIRTINKKPQAKLNEKQRKINIQNCFTWQGNYLNDKNILLIDDVVTTGSTLNECANILKKNGAKNVWALVAAKG